MKTILMLILMCASAAAQHTKTLELKPYRVDSEMYMVGAVLIWNPDTVPVLLMASKYNPAPGEPMYVIDGYMIEVPNQSYSFLDREMKPLDRSWLVWDYKRKNNLMK
jgi:hypothetical protein